jgi:lathosterol oxidase
MLLINSIDFPQLSFSAAFTIAYIVLLFRYLFIAGVAFLLVNFALKKQLAKRKIQKKQVTSYRMATEIIASMVSFIIFAMCMAVVIYCKQLGLTKIYSDWNLYFLGYGFISFFLLLIIHDTYFYWVHRLMHQPLIYQYVHLHHHKSVTPTPWTAFSFHPLEAFLEFAFVIPVVFIIPFHSVVLMLFAFVMTGMNVLGHLGYELFPKTFLNHPLGKIMNTTTHHDMHHRYNKYNYGLYFNFWDAIMHTNHKKYKNEFEKNR